MGTCVPGSTAFKNDGTYLPAIDGLELCSLIPKVLRSYNSSSVSVNPSPQKILYLTMWYQLSSLLSYRQCQGFTISRYNSLCGSSFTTLTLLAERADLYDATLSLDTVSNSRTPMPKPTSFNSLFIVVPSPLPRYSMSTILPRKPCPWKKLLLKQ